jgi:prepilin-type N-terminal cleavage/methylation domain-containing protein
VNRNRGLQIGFSLLEIMLVLALIGIAAALLAPSLTSAFAGYHLERAAEDLQTRLIRTRLQSIDLGVPYAFSYRPDTDQFMTWACEPLDIQQGFAGTSMAGSPLAAVAASGDAYDRRYFELNDRADDREFRFLSVSSSEALGAAGLGFEARGGTSAANSASVAASDLLSRDKLGLLVPSTRSIAAVQVAGLQLGDMAEPLVFEPDGTADRDAILRIADRSGRFVEVNVHGLTGAITASPAQAIAESGMDTVVTTVPARAVMTAPTRSRELRRRSE